MTTTAADFAIAAVVLMVFGAGLLAGYTIRGGIQQLPMRPEEVAFEDDDEEPDDEDDDESHRCLICGRAAKAILDGDYFCVSHAPEGARRRKA